MTGNLPIILREYENFPDPIYIPKQILDDFKSYFSKYLEIEVESASDETIIKLKLKAKYYIGILKFPNNQNYIILPKIENANFFKMLEYVEPKYTDIIRRLLQGITPNSNFLNLFIEQFLGLTEDLFRSFLRKNYQPKQKKTRFLKGKIIISDTLKNPKFLLGNIVCLFDDFTLDVFENQIIKYALYLLKPLSSDIQQDRIRSLLIKLESVSLKEFRALNLEKFRYNRLNSRYKTVHTYCKMIIERFSFGFNIGVFECFSMLLNSWDVYERFLRMVLKKYLPTDLIIEKKGTFLSWDKEKYIPDIIVRKKNNILLLGDAKYKLLWQISDRNQASQYLRHLKKLVRIEELAFDLDHRNLLLIYPLNEETDYNFKHIEELRDREEGLIFAHSIDLRKIDEMDYLKRWVEKIYSKLIS